MCIAIVSTEHPDYPLIILNNRDEYLHRPTAPADWWNSPNSHVLGGYDMLREAHGTWLGITRQGRIAVLTNFREEGQAIIQGAISRGAIVNSFLTTPPNSTETTEGFAKRLVEEEGVKGVGGFSLIYGHIKDVINGKGLAIVSNRTPDVEGLIWIATNPAETRALSNSHYGDRTWSKVVQAEEFVKVAIDESVAKKEAKEELLKRLFGLLSIDTFPREENGEEWDIYLRRLRQSIFIPAIGHDTLSKKQSDKIAAAHTYDKVEATSGIYGTQKQIVILVSKGGQVTYIERSLLDIDGNPIEKELRDREFEFNIEGW